MSTSFKDWQGWFCLTVFRDCERAIASFQALKLSILHSAASCKAIGLWSSSSAVNAAGSTLQCLAKRARAVAALSKQSDASRLAFGSRLKTWKEPRMSYDGNSAKIVSPTSRTHFWQSWRHSCLIAGVTRFSPPRVFGPEGSKNPRDLSKSFKASVV